MVSLPMAIKRFLIKEFRRFFFFVCFPPLSCKWPSSIIIKFEKLQSTVAEKEQWRGGSPRGPNDAGATDIFFVPSLFMKVGLRGEGGPPILRNATGEWVKYRFTYVFYWVLTAGHRLIESGSGGLKVTAISCLKTYNDNSMTSIDDSLEGHANTSLSVAIQRVITHG